MFEPATRKLTDKHIFQAVSKGASCLVQMKACLVERVDSISCFFRSNQKRRVQVLHVENLSVLMD